MLFFRSYFFKGSETDLNKLVQKQLALNSTITILEKLQPNARMLECPGEKALLRKAGNHNHRKAKFTNK